MRSDRGYRDPTADIAIGHVIKEQKRKDAMLKNRDGTVAPKRRAVPSWDEIERKIDEENNA